MKIKLIGTLLITAVVTSTVYYFGLWDTISNWIKPENLKNFINQFGIFAPLVFMALYYGLVLAFVSAAAFTVLAGLLFGKVWGTVYVIIAATAAAQTAFFITRCLGSTKLEPLKQKQGIGAVLKTVESRCKKNGFQSIFILRCLFAPYIPLSYASGMVNSLKARDFFFATLLTNMIFSPAFVFLGDSLLKGPKALLLPVIMVIIVLAVPKILGKFHPPHTS